MTLLSVDGLTVRHGQLTAAREVSFSISEGETLALVGANGAGKTTLLSSIAGAHPVASGTIRLHDKDVTHVPAYHRVGMGIALVPEGRRLFASMTVEENLILAGGRARKGEWTVDKVLDAFPMLKARRKAKAGNLSGGEQQATAIGRALMTNPSILLLDEVSLGLSPLAVDQVYSSLQKLMSSGSTILLVEQDLNRALRFATRVICMLEGRIVMQARTNEVTREQITDAYFGLDRGKHASQLAPPAATVP